MWIYISDTEYPEFTGLLRNPNRRMNFLHDIECELEGAPNQKDSLFFNKKESIETESPKEVIHEVIKDSYNSEELNKVLSLLNTMGGSMDGLMKRMELLEKNPVVQSVNSENIKKDEEDFSDTTGIDFSSAIAVFED